MDGEADQMDLTMSFHCDVHDQNDHDDGRRKGKKRNATSTSFIHLVRLDLFSIRLESLEFGLGLHLDIHL